MADPRYLGTAVSAMPGGTMAKVVGKEIDALFIKNSIGEHPAVAPEQFFPAIGKVVSMWAFQEWVLAGCICALMKIDRKVGRIAVGAPRVEDSISRIRQLLEVKNLSVKT